MKLLQKVLRGLAWLVMGIILFAGGSLCLAHRQIENVVPALPDAAALMAGADRSAPSGALPVRVFYVNTASQAAPRSLVLDGAADPTADAPYIMGHMAFGLEWADGRIFLIDTGLTPEAAPGFGKGAELLGASTTEAHGSVGDLLGSGASRVVGVGLTHRHQDHTDGLLSLCKGREGLIALMQTPIQTQDGNYTTDPGQAHIDRAICLAPVALTDGPVFAVTGFPGVSVIEAGGHTPGSQVFVAHVQPDAGGDITTYVFAGDIINNIDGIHHDVPKPGWYSWFLVPESEARLSAVRKLIRTIENDYKAVVLVPHDLLHVQSTGVAEWSDK